jgi:hypothetical protein
MRSAWTGFRSPLSHYISQFVAVKRALGCRFASEDRTLRLLDRFPRRSWPDDPRRHHGRRDRPVSRIATETRAERL